MQLIEIIILIVSALFAGSTVFFTKLSENHFRFLLAFGGSYLFGITLVHIIPELFQMTEQLSVMVISACIVGGFFFQMLLEFFSSGVEHGHIHHHHGKKITPLSLLIGLCIHALLDGVLLVDDHSVGHHHHHHHVHDGGMHVVLLGIVLHKMPAAFALTSILVAHYQKKLWPVVMLVIFALASPIGLLVSQGFLDAGLLSGASFVILMGIVAGGFLHISTTIFFESSPGHKLSFPKLFAALLGVGVAIAVEFLM